MKQPKVYFSRARRGLDVPREMDRMLALVIREVFRSEGVSGETSVAVTYTDDEGIREMNREYREIDRATDVLSFPMMDFVKGEPPEGAEEEIDPDTGRLFLGDVVISIPRAREQARVYGHSFVREMAFLTAHSALHLLGYDHEGSEEDRHRMEDKQERALSALGITREKD